MFISFQNYISGLMQIESLSLKIIYVMFNVSCHDSRPTKTEFAGRHSGATTSGVYQRSWHHQIHPRPAERRISTRLQRNLGIETVFHPKYLQIKLVSWTLFISKSWDLPASVRLYLWLEIEPFDACTLTSSCIYCHRYQHFH